MFFRRTKVANGLDGKSYYTYRLVENQREGTKFRQKTVLNLGANQGVPQSDWKAVAQRVEAIQHGQISYFEYPKHVESAAQSDVKRLRARDLNGDKLGTGSVVTVDLDTMKHTDVRSVGCERLCLQALEDLQPGRILDELGMSELDTRRALALVAAKMIHPASERETSRWIKDNSSLPELLGLTRSRDLERKTLYRIGDCLGKRQAEIEKHLFRRERDLLNIPATIVFHDLSNTHCTDQHHDQGLRRFGRSKQRRNDCPLVTLALVLDEKGFPRSSEVLPGNVGEAKTLEAALKNLEEVHGCRDPNNRPTVIMDAGIATDDNLKFLKENGYDWICISRKARVAPPDCAPDSTLHTKAKHLVEAWRISDKDADELQLYARSEGRRQTEASILARQRSKLEAELQYLHDGLSLPRRMKRHDRVLEKIGRLKERYSGVASQYMIRIERTGDTATAVRFKRQDKADLADAAAGSCVLRTSHTDWDAEKILRTYWRLTDLENTFRQLKSELGLRPIWHSTDARISAHLFITVLAYHAVHLIRTRLRDNDINLRWDSIRNRMASWERITTTQQTPTGQQVVVRQDARPSDEVATIARHVNVHVGAYRQRL